MVLAIGLLLIILCSNVCCESEHESGYGYCNEQSLYSTDGVNLTFPSTGNKIKLNYPKPNTTINYISNRDRRFISGSVIKPNMLR